MAHHFEDQTKLRSVRKACSILRTQGTVGAEILLPVWRWWMRAGTSNCLLTVSSSAMALSFHRTVRRSTWSRVLRIGSCTRLYVLMEHLLDRLSSWCVLTGVLARTGFVAPRTAS